MRGLHTESAITLACILFALTTSGCDRTSSSPELVTKSEVPTEKRRYAGDYTEYSNSEICDGNTGPLVLARGKVLKSDGASSPFTVVTLDHILLKGPRRCLVTKSDADGNYVVRGEEHCESATMVWAATAEGSLGASWLKSGARTSEPTDIQLRGGEMVLHVRNENCEPIAGATVSVYMSGIDDMSWIVPPNIRQLLTKTTNDEGIVRFPSRLGDYDLGFDVSAAGYRPLARDSYSGLRAKQLKLFILGIDPDAAAACSNRFLEEKFPDTEDIPIVNVGRPDHL